MTSVLLLNADMRPLKTVNIQRAISLLIKGKVDIIESVPGKELRSPSTSIPMPSILRLRYYANVPQRKAVWSRRAVFSRDNYTCQYCAAKLSRETATLDHIVPVEQCKIQGIRASTWSNTCCACEKCNFRKANRSAHEAGMKFYNSDFIPKTPRASYLIVSSDVPESWRVYIKS